MCPASLQAEGPDLMWLLLASKKQVRLGALRVMDYATTRFAPPCDVVSDSSMHISETFCKVGHSVSSTPYAAPDKWYGLGWPFIRVAACTNGCASDGLFRLL